MPLLASHSRSALTRLTVALALLLGAALLWAVVAEMRFQRRTTEKVSEDYVALLARERVDSASSALNAVFSGALGSQIGGTMGSVYDELPPPTPAGPMSKSLSNSLRCGDAKGQIASYFRIDLRDSSFLASPRSRDGTIDWVRDAVTAHMQAAGPLTSGRFRTLLTHGRAVTYGVKYAPYDAPVAVYGLVTCPHALAAVLSAAAPRGATESVISILAVAGTDTLFGHSRGVSPALATTDVGGIQLSTYATFAQPLSGIVIERDVVPPVALTLMLAGTIALASIAVAQLIRDRRAVRMQAELITTISHELRTPLAQILLYSETLALDRVRGDAAKQAAAQRIVDEARRLAEIVSNVVGLSRAEKAVNAVTPVAPVIEAAITGVRALSDARAKVVVTLSGTPKVALSDSALLQALTNVLDNALKFGPAAQTVVVSTERDRSMIRISVEDEGPGIPQAQRERIWTKYFRASDTPTPPGAGIGLWIVRDIVAAAGGRVWVDEAKSGGTRIVLELPAADES
ncbi:MAG: HAMP domain-containing histidine kinase [Gemmatimonadota bacterium]|nr:HAMP domain-containing histidine kinase [Gemmatimonadota bacterium]